MTTSMPL